VAGGGGLVGLGRKRPSGLGFDRGLHGKDAGASRIVSRGSVWRDGGRRGTQSGGARRGDSGEGSREREGGGEGENRPAMLLTTTRSSWRTCATAESGGAAARPAAEVRRRQACTARVCGVRRRLRVLRLYRAADKPRRAGPGHRAGGGQAVVGLGCESEPGSSLRTGPIGGSRLSARERKDRREVPVGLGRRGLGWLGCAVERKKKAAGLGLWEEKERGEKEKESGPGQKRKRGRKRNAFEFKFEI
jgi:hypothetical protein